MTLDLSNPDRLPFRDLPDEVAAGMMLAYHRRGAKVDVWIDKGGWLSLPEYETPEWFEGTFYRIRPAPVTADVIPWAVIDPRLKYSARDADGDMWGFAESPVVQGEWWANVSDEECARLDGVVAGVIPGTCDWRDSLQQRPEGV